MQCLKNKNIDRPKLSVLNTFLVGYRKKVSPPIVSFGELESYVLSHVQMVENENKAFVVHSHFQYEDKIFGVFVSTNRLMGILHKSKVIQADATYKLNWQGFPVMVVGTSDMDRKFHPGGIAITTNESTNDFKFLFDGIKKLRNDYSPNVLIADAADAITNGFKGAFGHEFIRVYCWAHVIRNIDKKIFLVCDPIVRSKIRADIIDLQLSRSREEFEFATTLLFKKYENITIAATFFEYFKSEWIDQHDGWFEGQVLCSPSTNNGLESINNRIKLDGTLRERLQIKDFMGFMLRQCEIWSDERDPQNINCKYFVTKPSIPLKIQVSF